MFDAGDTIGEYEIVSRLNQGGMATLFIGRRVGAAPGDPPVAIKVIHESLSEDWQFVRMFIDEALISVRIRHPNVVRVDELGEVDGQYFLAMEYVHGCSLAQLLRALSAQRRRMRPEIAVWIASQVARGLHAAHEMIGDDGRLLNVIHRDVSPQNILLSVDGGVKLLDFGIAKAAGRAERTEAGVIKGKVRYMAPEQAMGHDLDQRVDIYALAVVLWETLTMRRFIEGRNEVELLRKVRRPDLVPPSLRAPGIPTSVDDAVMAALRPERDARPATAEAFASLLDRAMSATVAPAHLAELLRVFLGDELRAEARALPKAISGSLEASANQARALPGEDASEAAAMNSEERTRTLTVEVAEELAQNPAPLDGAGRDAATRARPRKRPAPAAPLDSAEATIDPAVLDGMPSYAEDVDDEATMEASGPELHQFLARIRKDSTIGKGEEKRSALPSVQEIAPRAAPPAPARRIPPPVSRASTAKVAATTLAGRAEPGPVAAPAFTPKQPPPEPVPVAPAPVAAPARGPSVVLRVVLITLLAFALGAGAAALWLHFGS